jgi:hypothetical protein
MQLALAFRFVPITLTFGVLLGVFGQAVCSLASATVSAAEPPRLQEALAVPAKWEKVAAAQFGTIEYLIARDDYIVWIERKLDPATALHRARTFAIRLYRLKLPGGEVETLEVGITNETFSAPIVGEAGVVGWETSYQKFRLYVPGKPALDYVSRQPDGSSDIPQGIFRDVLLCHTRFATDRGLTLVPTKDALPQYDERYVIVPWKLGRPLLVPGDDQQGHADYQADFFYNGKVWAFTKRQQPRKNWRGEPLTILWDGQAKKRIWIEPGWPLALDASHVYACPALWAYQFPGIREIWRRPIAGNGAGEKLTLPWPVTAIVDFQPPKLQTVIEREKKSVLATIDLETGAVSEVALELPSLLGQRLQRDYVQLWKPADLGDGKPRYAVSGNTKAGFLVVTNGVIYRVPSSDDAADDADAKVGSTNLLVHWTPLEETKQPK